MSDTAIFSQLMLYYYSYKLCENCITNYLEPEMYNVMAVNFIDINIRLQYILFHKTVTKITYSVYCYAVLLTRKGLGKSRNGIHEEESICRIQ